MKSIKICITLLGFAVLLILIEQVKAQYAVKQSVVGNGGTGLSDSTYHLVATIGQPGIGRANSAVNIHKAGFWYQAGNIFTSIEFISNNLPKEFKLEQNYPNPFNMTTTIEYALPNSSDVRLLIYDLLGRYIKTLVNIRQQAGRFQITWDSTDENNMPVATGVYFCRLEASDNPSTRSAQRFVKVIKLALVK